MCACMFVCVCVCACMCVSLCIIILNLTPGGDLSVEARKPLLKGQEGPPLFVLYFALLTQKLSLTLHHHILKITQDSKSWLSEPDVCQMWRLTAVICSAGRGLFHRVKMSVVCCHFLLHVVMWTSLREELPEISIQSNRSVASLQLYWLKLIQSCDIFSHCGRNTCSFKNKRKRHKVPVHQTSSVFIFKWNRAACDWCHRLLTDSLMQTGFPMGCKHHCHVPFIHSVKDTLLSYISWYRNDASWQS